MIAIRHLCLIFGDQLNEDSILFDGFDPQQDLLWMAETLGENTHVPSSKQRSAMFIAAMRHFAHRLRQHNFPLVYRSLDDTEDTDFAVGLSDLLQHYCVSRVRVVLPGDYRVLHTIRKFFLARDIPVDVLADNHFIALPGEFTAWCNGKKQLRMEYWYRQLRKRTGVLMEAGSPVGGEWNYDKANRGSFDRRGPGFIEQLVQFPLDEITHSAIATVERVFANHPGSLATFSWPVTRDQALVSLRFFIEHHLPVFGEYQDAMWTHEPWLYHSRLSAALNTKLLSPREVIQAAEAAYRAGLAPLNAVEGFIRQILGWREYVRGLYWRLMPEWLTMNALDAREDLPDFYWTADVDMNCLRHSIQQVLDVGYGHHIQRLMVTGLFAQLWQTQPTQIHAWYLAMYIDAVEWVELPNVLGMSQYADGGIMASKPYIATGRYIAKMSNYCDDCEFVPEEAETESACPFTTLYWTFLMKHRDQFVNHPRLGLQVKHLDAMSDEKRVAIRERAMQVRARYPTQGYLWKK